MTRIGSLCSGYGGLDLAVLAVLGGHVVWHAETDPDASRVLAAQQGALALSLLLASGRGVA